MGAVASFMYGRPLPDSGRHLYFSERLYLGWLELLCCPEVAGCNVRNYVEGDHRGGSLQYTVLRSVSYSPYVPRFVMEIRNKTMPRPAVVGRMEKLDTVVRAKSGEFLSIQLWKMVCNGLQWTDKRKRRVLPSDSDSFVMHVAIATQAKIDFVEDEEDENLDNRSERWVQTISTDNPALSIWNKKTMQGSPGALCEIKLSYEGQNVGTAKQKIFDSGEDHRRPFLGIQLDRNTIQEKAGLHGEVDQDTVAEHTLNTDSVALVLLCLAWSHRTMSFDPEEERIYNTFAKALRSKDKSSVMGHSHPPDWTLLDVKRYLKEHKTWLKLHSWDSGASAARACTTLSQQSTPSRSEIRARFAFMSKCLSVFDMRMSCGEHASQPWRPSASPSRPPRPVFLLHWAPRRVAT
eukprot:s3096_g4.t2